MLTLWWHAGFLLQFIYPDAVPADTGGSIAIYGNDLATPYTLSCLFNGVTSVPAELAYYNGYIQCQARFRPAHLAHLEGTCLFIAVTL